MRSQHVVSGDNSILKSESGVTQLLISLLQNLLAHDKTVGSFIHFEYRMAE
jgi:hypothetical protein